MAIGRTGSRRTSLAALEASAVDEEVGVLAVERSGPSGLDGGERFLVQVGDGSGEDRGSLRDFGHVLNAPGRDAGQAHLVDRLLDARLAPVEMLDHRRLEPCAAQLGDLEVDLSTGRASLLL